MGSLKRGELVAIKPFKILGGMYSLHISDGVDKHCYDVDGDYIHDRELYTGATVEFWVGDRYSIRRSFKKSTGRVLLQMVDDFVDYAFEAASSIPDCKIHRDQLDRMEKEGQEAMTAIMSFLEMARRVHSEQYGEGR